MSDLQETVNHFYLASDLQNLPCYITELTLLHYKAFFNFHAPWSLFFFADFFHSVLSNLSHQCIKSILHSLHCKTQLLKNCFINSRDILGHPWQGEKKTTTKTLKLWALLERSIWISIYVFKMLGLHICCLICFNVSKRDTLE